MFHEVFQVRFYSKKNQNVDKGDFNRLQTGAIILLCIFSIFSDSEVFQEKCEHLIVKGEPT